VGKHCIFQSIKKILQTTNFSSAKSKGTQPAKHAAATSLSHVVYLKQKYTTVEVIFG